MSKISILTLAMLKTAKACPEQCKLFVNIFPDGATRHDLAKALEVGLDVLWCKELLSKDALAEYEKIQSPAYAEYLKIQGSAYAEYKKIIGSAWAEYEKIQDPAQAEYKRICIECLVNLLFQ